MMQFTSYKTNDNKAFGCKQKLLEVPWCKVIGDCDRRRGRHMNKADMRKGMLLKGKVGAEEKYIGC